MVKKFDTHLRFGRALSLASLGLTLTLITQSQPSFGECWCAVLMEGGIQPKSQTYSCLPWGLNEENTDHECNNRCIIAHGLVGIFGGKPTVGGAASKEGCEAIIIQKKTQGTQ